MPLAEQASGRGVERPRFGDVELRSGLYYVHRDGMTISQLDGRYFPQLDRPERDVVAAYLRYALDRIAEGSSGESG